jgi:hypothetical protein
LKYGEGQALNVADNWGGRKWARRGLRPRGTSAGWGSSPRELNLGRRPQDSNAGCGSVVDGVHPKTLQCHRAADVGMHELLSERGCLGDEPLDHNMHITFVQTSA